MYELFLYGIFIGLNEIPDLSSELLTHTSFYSEPESDLLQLKT